MARLPISFVSLMLIPISYQQIVGAVFVASFLRTLDEIFTYRLYPIFGTVTERDFWKN